MKLRVTVNDVAYDVEVDLLEDLDPSHAMHNQTAAVAHTAVPPRPVTPSPVPTPAPAAPVASAAPTGRTVNSPIPGTVVEILVAEGQSVAANETLIVLDAMKMNTPVSSPTSGVVKRLLIAVGEVAKMGQPLVEFE